MDTNPAGGWHPDPTGRFELRYFNGRDWTADVSSNGNRYVDPFGSHASVVHPAGQVPAGNGQPNGRATAALVFGIVAVIIGWLPFLFVFGIVAAALAIGFGVVARRRAKVTGTGASFSVAGLSLGCAGLAVCVLGFVLTLTSIEAFDAYDNPAPNAAEILACEHSETDHTARFSVTNLHDQPADFAVRIEFVRFGTDNVQRQQVVVVDDVAPGATVLRSATRSMSLTDVDCVIGAVHGPLPFGFDPGR